MSEPLKCSCLLCDSEHSVLLELSREDAIRKCRDFASSRPVLSGVPTTVHANCSAQVLSRFTSCVLQSGVDLPYRAIKTNIADSLNLLIHLERRPGRRFVSEVAEIAAYKPDLDRYELESIFVCPEDQSDCQS